MWYDTVRIHETLGEDPPDAFEASHESNLASKGVRQSWANATSGCQCHPSLVA